MAASIGDLRLRLIEVADFRQSEMTNWEECVKKNKQLIETFRADDVVLFISQSMNQLVFVHGFSHLGGATQRDVLVSKRLRLKNGTWSSDMLQEYARECGIQLQGIRTFAEVMQERALKKKEGS